MNPHAVIVGMIGVVAVGTTGLAYAVRSSDPGRDRERKGDDDKRKGDDDKRTGDAENKDKFKDEVAKYKDAADKARDELYKAVRSLEETRKRAKKASKDLASKIDGSSLSYDDKKEMKAILRDITGDA